MNKLGWNASISLEEGLTECTKIFFGLSRTNPCADEGMLALERGGPLHAMECGHLGTINATSRPMGACFWRGVMVIETARHCMVDTSIEFNV